MLSIYIASTDRTADVDGLSLTIDDQIQQRSNSASLVVFQNTKPSENDDFKIYKGSTIATIVGATITLNSRFQTGVSMFFTGQKIHIGIGNSDEEIVEVLSYTESTRTIVLLVAPIGMHIAGDKIGELIFGGVVSRVESVNVETLDNVEYRVEGVDYTKIFDKKLIADTWVDVDSRYVINDFVNTTVNYNATIDNVAYANDAAIQAEWIEANDGSNPTVNTSDYLESTASGVFTWVFAAGTAVWAATPSSTSVANFLGVNSGTPTKGNLMVWIKTSDYSKITTFKIRIGSSSTAYAELRFYLKDTTDWQYVSAKFTDATITGVPDWTALDYVQVRVVETSSGNIKLNGIRINATGSFTLYEVHSTPLFDDLRSPQLKPTSLMQLLAKTWQYIWYIDYERDIHFVDSDVTDAPFQITDTSDNFTDLSIEVDQSQLGNRIIVRGGEKTSTSTYAQVIEGDGTKREWLMKTKFNNLALLIDDNTSTDTMEAGTTTTTVNATAHGLLVGDHIVQRSRNNVVREVLTVPNANQFTVELVTAQVATDTFSKFSVSKTDGIEGITDETTVDYVANSNEKSVRATESEATLNAATFIRFAYNERTPIQIQYSDPAAQAALKALGGFGDGVIDLDPITDRNIQDQATAIALAQAKVQEYSNPIISGKFKTDQHGLKAGQVVRIQDTNRSLDQEYVIQKIKIKQQNSEYADYFIFEVSFGTTLFGLIEFYQKLLATKDSIELNVDDVVETFIDSAETVESDDVSVVSKVGFELAASAEETTSDDVDVAVDWTSGTFQFEPSVGQTLPTRFDLSDFG